MEEGGIDAFVEGLVPKLFAPEHLESMGDKVNQAKEIGKGTSPRGAAATQEGMRRRPDRNDVLEKAAVPILLAAGAKDSVIAPEKTFSVDHENIRTVTFEETGHMSMYEAPDQLGEAMESFLQPIYG